MKIIVVIFFTMTFGVVESQMSFFASVDLHTKMSFNSNNPTYWETNKVNFSNEFIYENANFTLWDPFRLGGSIGVKFKSGNELMTSLQYDGVTATTRIVFPDPVYSINADPNTIDIVSNGGISRSRSQQTKLSLLYYFNFITHKKNKTTFAISPIISFIWRAGPLGASPAGSVGFKAQLPNNKILQYDNTSFVANGKYAFVYGLALKSDLYRKDKYLFSIGLQFSLSKRYLGYDKSSIKIIDNNTNKATNYIFYQYYKASGIYFTVSRKFQILPWKKRKVGTESK